MYTLCHIENFNGLEINLYKDEINVMEKNFETLDKCSNETQLIQPDYFKKKELIELNSLGYCYQYEFKAFEFYLKSSAEEGNFGAQII
jgi:hypothetical protein